MGKSKALAMEAAAEEVPLLAHFLSQFSCFPRMMSYMNTPYLHADVFQTTS